MIAALDFQAALPGVIVALLSGGAIVGIATWRRVPTEQAQNLTESAERVLRMYELTLSRLEQENRSLSERLARLEGMAEELNQAMTRIRELEAERTRLRSRVTALEAEVSRYQTEHP